MLHRIEKVFAKDSLLIEAVFLGGEVKQYCVEWLFGRFPEFLLLKKDAQLFAKVHVDAGGYGISWNDELDLDAETIWEDGILIETQPQTDINRILAYRLLLAREKADLTQKQLAERTGIYQADISKLERGLSNPSLSTLKRLADGLEMDLQVDFIARPSKDKRGNK